MKGTFVEARCPSTRCSKTHLVMRYEDGTVQKAFCPPSKLHKGWRGMKVGSVQVATHKAVTG